METIFRIQDKDGRGPWKPGFSHKWVEDRDDHNNLQPWQIEFVTEKVHALALSGERLGCGCASPEILRRWITPTEYAKLKAFGYKAVKVEGRILASSPVQCVFACAHPLAEVAFVDDVVAWAGTVHGGKQLGLHVIETPASCESRFGLCE